MPLGFGYLYKFVMFYFFFFQKAENNRLKKASWSKFCNIIFIFLLNPFMTVFRSRFGAGGKSGLIQMHFLNF